MGNEIVKKLLRKFSDGHKPCIDSREAQNGDIFFALQGENVNGNRFAAKALENGCHLAVVDDQNVATGKNFLLVDDVLDTLQQVSMAYRQTLTIPFIGITGSNGKTTTKELMHAVFASKYRTFALPGTLTTILACR